MSVVFVCSALARKNGKQLRQEYDHARNFGTMLRLAGEDTKPCTVSEKIEKLKIKHDNNG